MPSIINSIVKRRERSPGSSAKPTKTLPSNRLKDVARPASVAKGRPSLLIIRSIPLDPEGDFIRDLFGLQEGIQGEVGFSVLSVRPIEISRGYGVFQSGFDEGMTKQG